LQTPYLCETSNLLQLSRKPTKQKPQLKENTNQRGEEEKKMLKGRQEKGDIQTFWTDGTWEVRTESQNG